MATHILQQGAAKMAPRSSHRPKRDPITIDHLRALHCHLDHSNAFDITVFVIACIAFWCCCRLGELIIDAPFDPKAHVARSTTITRGTASNGSRYINFDVPRTKTKADSDHINISDST